MIEMRTPAQRIRCGPIQELLADLGLPSPVLVLGSRRSIGAVDWDPLERAARVSFFAGSTPHNPQEAVDEAAGIARAMEPAAILAVGSASAIDLGKAVAQHAAGAELVAIPTTLGGAEMTRGYGVLQPTAQKAVAAMHGVYGTVCYDPELLATLPRAVLGSTGINGWAHAVEAHYARRVHWLGRAAARRAGGRFPALLLAAGERRDAAVHAALFEAACLAGFALNACGMALHHATCHALGGLTQIPHGVLNAMVLPHALRLNAGIAPRQVAAVAEAFGIADLAAEAERLRDAFALPRSLAEIGVTAETAERAAEPILASTLLRNNPEPVGRDEVSSLLRAVHGPAA